jgi:hypothetical protein
MGISREEYNKRQRERRKANGNKTTKKYEKTVNGFLMRAYRNMKSRVNGIQKLKSHLYKGLFLLDKEVFYVWAREDNNFNGLYWEWVNSGYNKKLTPSIDRIDSDKGYSLDNMRWVTHSDNSKFGAISKHSKAKNDTKKA